MRQNEDQRNQQHELAQDGHDDGARRVADGNKRHLAGNLNTEDEQRAAIDAQRLGGEDQQLGVRRENPREGLREEHDAAPEDDRIRQAGLEQREERLPDARGVSRAEVVAGNRLRALRQPLQREHRELHHAGENRHRADGDIAAVFEQRGIEADGDDALRALHDERGQAERDARGEELHVDAHILRLEAQARLFTHQEADDPHAGNALRNHRRQRRATNAHVQAENENRVEHDVAHRADEHGHHARRREALRGDERIHAERQLHKQRAEGVDVQIIVRVFNRVFARAEGQQKFVTEQQQHRRQRQRNRDLQRKAAAQQLFGRVVIAAPHRDGSPRRAAGGDQRRERRHDHNDRHAHAHASQREAADARDVTDVDAIHDVVEHIDQLGDDRRNGQPHQQPADRLRAQKRLISGLHIKQILSR